MNRVFIYTETGFDFKAVQELFAQRQKSVRNEKLQITSWIIFTHFKTFEAMSLKTLTHSAAAYKIRT